MRIAVIGGGVFGAMSAVSAADVGHTVTLFERLPALMRGASRVGNRLHMGFHYPRHEQTVRQCILGYERFKKAFAAAILSDVTNAYFIASERSLTSADAFLAFCDRLGLPYRQLDPARFANGIDHVDLGIVTPEVMYDPGIVRRMMTTRLAQSGTTVRLRTEVVDITRNGDNTFTVSTGDEGRHVFEAVVNCAYANANRMADHLGHPQKIRQYEYTAVPIVQLDYAKPTSVTILDGPFFSLLPFGSSGDHLLFHVQHSVVAREDVPFVNPAWLNPETSPLASLDAQALFELIRSSSATFMPSLRTARLKGFAQGPRVVLENAEDTDARPSLVTLREPGFIDVFSGKVDHCMWVADDVVNLLDATVNAPVEAG